MILSFRCRNIGGVLLVGIFITVGIWLLVDNHLATPSHPLSATNATLGFQKIQVVNLPHRFDREDAILMQCRVSGLKYEIFPGIYAANLQDSGLPPSSKPVAEKNIKACFRAHANIWQQMLKEEWGSVLILEADASWDLEIRPIMQRVSQSLNKLMDRYPSPFPDAVATENDPYNAAKWDMIMLGQCFESPNRKDENIIFSDPDSPVGKNYYDIPLNDQRVIRRSGKPTCTTAYAISPSGAMKLLLRSSLDLNKPVDLIIEELVESGNFNSYSVHPPPFAQWAYAEHIGAESHNSDIESNESKVDEKSGEAWEKVHSDMNVWRVGDMYRDSQFRHPAFAALKNFTYV
ncbi:hypothetical protein NADFUDRAFT_47623 [Nadsonia fulvescens var. elongata DSM 6958]|uniref:Glycosyl transferase family 25 domain-containing protein n=1 Tax=Nadsonia fulvescens var. elongata DSM 6958 TaxID=857566 RepID=A0A1E3PGE2_9ASCO|nr:hypothetical protein NADFUDRAFT_47623 [Nadsonia fulvescens var. elongata DSM 6958]